MKVRYLILMLGTQDPCFKNGKLFDGVCATFSASYYLQRISKYSGAGSSSLVAALLYLERLKSKQNPITLTTTNLQRLLLVSVMTATKFLEDICYPFKCW